MKAFPSEMSKEELARREYELARKAGDKRFRSECRHERVSGGRCLDCWRKVVG